MANMTPAQAWRELKDGNVRFVADTPQHPCQGIDDRNRLTTGQAPKAVLFGCSDSRVAAELVFDQGLGELFVVRTAGQAIDAAVLGSIEYAVAVLGTPLIAVLGHEKCGAVAATLQALETNVVPGGYIRDIVERVTPSILAGRNDGLREPHEFEARHVHETAATLAARSTIIADKLASGALAIVGLTYSLADGKVALRETVGDVDDAPEGAQAIGER